MLRLREMRNIIPCFLYTVAKRFDSNAYCLSLECYSNAFKKSLVCENIIITLQYPDQRPQIQLLPAQELPAQRVQEKNGYLCATICGHVVYSLCVQVFITDVVYSTRKSNSSTIVERSHISKCDVLPF